MIWFYSLTFFFLEEEEQDKRIETIFDKQNLTSESSTFVILHMFRSSGLNRNSKIKESVDYSNLLITETVLELK